MAQKISMIPLRKIPLLVLMAFGVLACQRMPSTAAPNLPATEITDAKGIRMRLVSAGSFIMGSDNGTDDAKPARTVTLSDYYMDTYEVTRLRYKECVVNGACSEARDLASINSFYADSNYPMILIDWNQSRTYCEWRGAHLPSEAEWEKAARGTDGRTYPWGEELDSSYADYGDGSGGVTAVGSHPRNISPYGMYDMAGNVWEWTADPYAAYAGNTSTDGAAYDPTSRVLRGGTWYYGDPIVLSTTFRLGMYPQAVENDFGFRCARGISP